MAEIERELEWDDVIEKESDEFVLLPEGEYEFEVTSFERARHPGSAKLPPCKKAILSLKIETTDGVCIIKHNLFLYSKCEGMLSAFFICIGQKKHGEPLKMEWNKVIGSKGKAKIGIHEWKSERTGETLKSNDVKRFLEPSEPAVAAPKFTPGTF